MDGRPREGETLGQVATCSPHAMCDELVSHVGVYDRLTHRKRWSSTVYKGVGGGAGPPIHARDQVLGWFRALNPARRQAVLTVHDPGWVCLCCNMERTRQGSRNNGVVRMMANPPFAFTPRATSRENPVLVSLTTSPSSQPLKDSLPRRFLDWP